MAAFLKQYGDVEGPLGLPMKEELAKDVDALLKTLSKECQDIGLRRVSKMPTSMSLEEGERADISFVTTDTMDADRELVLPGDIDWSRFRKAGMPVTWCHNYSTLPVGRSAWVKRTKQEDKNGWLAKTLYTVAPAAHKGDWFPDSVWHMVKEKIIRGKSIGFIPTKMRAPTEKEAKEYEGLRWVFESVLILEYAVTPIQSNPDAVVEEVSKCIAKGLKIDDTILVDMGLIIPEDLPAVQKDAPPPMVTPPVVEPVKKFVTLEDYQLGVLKGLEKKLGSFDVQKMIQDRVDLAIGRV